TPALAIAADVEAHAAMKGTAGPALHHGTAELLDGGERLALGADEQPEVVAFDLDLDGLVIDLGLADLAVEAVGLDEALDEVGDDVGLVVGGGVVCAREGDLPGGV